MIKLTSRTLFLVAAIITFEGCTRHPGLFSSHLSSKQLSRELDVLFSSPSFSNAHWGVVVKSLKNDQILYQRNANKGFIPASNLKILTTAAALNFLGPQFRFCTSLYYKGIITDRSVLDGDLILRGGGDPTLNDSKHLVAIADSLHAMGVVSISGRIVGDDNHYEDENLGAGWEWDDLSDDYAAQISALSLNDNCVKIDFTPGILFGDLSTFSLHPPTDYVSVQNRVTTVESDSRIILKRPMGSNWVMCSGVIDHQVKKHRERFTVDNPTRYAVHVLREVLLSRHIDVAGAAFDIDDLADYSYSMTPDRIVARFQSPELSRIVTIINKESQNLYSELVMRELGKRCGKGGTAAAGIAVAKNWIIGMGIDTVSAVIADGSGLSRRNLLTPMCLVDILQLVRQQSDHNIFFNSLPIAGIDGTLENRMNGTAAHGKIHAKTGTLGAVKALSGYATTLDGEELAFSIIANNFTVSGNLADRIQDTACQLLAGFSRKRASGGV